MNSVVGTILLILAVVLLVVGVLAWQRRLPGNNVIGLRLPEVRKSRDVWAGAHAVAGPVWIFGGIALLFGALVAYVAFSWLWCIPIATVCIALYTLGAGANIGARTAAILDAEASESSSCCSSGGTSSTDTVSQDGASGSTKAQSAIDLDAVRRAARSQD